LVNKKSKKTQSGKTIKRAAKIIPNGFIIKAWKKNPFTNDTIARVDPQDGHGSAVICLNKQTLTAFSGQRIDQNSKK
jgi:hypothetical protein